MYTVKKDILDVDGSMKMINAIVLIGMINRWTFVLVGGFDKLQCV